MSMDFEERDRRYALVRENMRAQGVAALIVVGDSQINHKGFVRYLTNYRSILYNLAVIFPLEGEPCFLVPSPLQNYWGKLASWVPRVEQAPNLGEGLAKNMKEMGLTEGKIGLVNDKIVPAQVYCFLQKELQGVTWCDGTAAIDKARSVKSVSEQVLVKKAASLAKLSFQVLSDVLKPGRTEREVMAEVDRALLSEGAEDIFHLFSSKPGNLFPYVFTDRVIETGDVVVMNTELSGPGGYWVQMVRMSFVGDAPRKSLKAMYDSLASIQAQIKEQLRPGRKVSEVAGWVRDQIRNHGFDTGVHFGHCLGLDVVEPPLVHLDDNTILQPGMVITVHPQFVSRNEQATVWLGDTYLIASGSAEVLTQFD